MTQIALVVRLQVKIKLDGTRIFGKTENFHHLPAVGTVLQRKIGHKWVELIVTGLVERSPEVDYANWVITKPADEKNHAFYLGLIEGDNDWKNDGAIAPLPD